MRVPGGAPPAWVWGVPGQALSHPRLPALWAGCRGALATGCQCGGVRAWGPVTNPTARALSSWLCALWGRHEGARGGGRLLSGCGASGVGPSPTPDCPPSGRAAGAHYPLAVGAGGCGRGDPSPTLQRALLRAGFARCGGGMRVPGRGPSCLGVGCPGSGALPPPTARSLGGLLGPTTHWLCCGGVRAWGPVTNPTARALSSWLCALWGRHEGARGGAPPPWVWGVRGWALSHPRLPALWAGCRGPLPTGCGCGGVRAWGPVTNPTARALSSWLCALWGRHEGAREGRLLPGCGASGVGRSPTPDCPPSGRAAGAHYPLAVAAGGAGVGTRHQPHSAPSFELALHAVGAARGRPGGGRLLPTCGASGVGRSPVPDCPPSGRAAGAHYPLAVAAGGCGLGDPSPTPQRALFRAGFARCGGGMRVPGGGRLLPGCGASGVGRSPTPDCLPSWRAAGAHYPLAVGAGGRGRGDLSPTPQRALLRAGFACCRGGMRVPGGVASCLVPPPTARPSGELPGCCACACPAWPGRAGRTPGRVLVRLTFRFAFLALLFACSAPSGLGLPCLWLLLGLVVFFFRYFSPSPPRCAPFVSCFACFPAPGALGLGVLPPPPLFFSLPPLCAPRCLLLCVFSGLGCRGPWRLVAPPPPSFFFVFFAPPPPCCLWPFLLSGCLWPLRAPALFFFFFPCPAAFFSCCASAVCALGCRAVCSLSWLFVVLCASSVLFLVAGVVGSWCRCLLLGVCRWLCLPGVVVWWCVSALVPVSGLAVARRPPCAVQFSCAVSCGAVLPCGAVLWCPVSFFFVFLPAGGAGFLVVPRWFWAPGRFRVVSVSVLCLCGAVLVCLRRCSLFGALLPSRGWLVFCVVACCVCVFAVGPGCPLLCPGGSWWLLVLCVGGVQWCVPGCCAAPCCCALCRLTLRCCALCCFVLLCLVLLRAVLCPGALSFWRRVLSCPPALCVFCFGVSLRGVVRRCALCRVHPGVLCCVFLAVSALCGVAVWPALPRCPASLCCPLWCCAAAWCRGVLSCCSVGFVSCEGVVVPTTKTAAKFRKIFFSSFFGF